MKRKMKTAAVLTAGALMTIGASGTAFAATAHWEQEGEDWVYLDKDGDKVTDTWKKSGNYWFYLDSDGYMAKDAIITSGSNDDKYYVDANGAKAANKWVAVENADEHECADQEDISTVWYFFGSDGKAKRAESGKKVFTGIPHGEAMDKKGTFAFDEEGHMLSGWQDIELSSGKSATYYFGDESEGAAVTGWQYLEIPEEDYDSDNGPEDSEGWYYFGTNGRAVKDQNKYINGFYYTFDENGVMDDTWVVGTPGVSSGTVQIATDAAAFYTEDIGYRRSGWIYTYDPEDKDQEGDQYWFYLSSKGEAFNDEAKDAKAQNAEGVTATDLYTGDVYYNVAAKVIKNKTYLFDENGRVLDGVFRLDGEAYRSGGSKLVDEGIYYFSTDDGSENGQMQIGKTEYDDEGEKTTYYFKKSGQAYTNALVSGAIYDEEGKRVDAEDGSTYMLYTTNHDITDESGKKVLIQAGTQVAVNRSGSVKRSGTVEIDGVKYTINKDTYEATEKVTES